MKWRRTKTPTRGEAVRSPLFSPLFSEEMTCCGSKNDFFAKNLEVYFLALKYKTTPVLAKLAGTCTKFKKYLRRLLQQNESFYAYSRMSTIYLGCFPSFRFRVSVAASPKNPIVAPWKWKKALLVGRNENRPPWHSSPSQGQCACPIWPCSNKLCHAHGRI
jgi:hypothetical protein